MRLATSNLCRASCFPKYCFVESEVPVMLSLLSRSAGGPPNSLHLATLSSLLQQISGTLAFHDSSTATQSTSSKPSTSYTPLHLSNPLQLQQCRAYRIPNRVLQPKTAYSESSGRPAPSPLPELEPIKAPPSELRWHRSVVRFPPEVGVALEDGGPAGGRMLVVSGRAGSIRISLKELDPTGLLAFRLLSIPTSASPAAPKTAASPSAPGPGQRSLLLLVSPDKARFEAAGAALNTAIRGVMTGYLVGLTVKGVGYRMEPVEDEADIRRAPSLSVAQLARRKRAPGGPTPPPHYFEAADVERPAVAFPHNKPASAIRLKVGYSRTAVYPLPTHIRAFFLKPTLVYLYGVELDELRRVAAEIRAIRPPNPYTGNGVQYVDEVVKLKQRAGAK